MKTKKLSLTMIFLAITLAIYIAVTLLFCYTTKPLVSQGEFPFSITYVYKGETKTLAGVLKTEYSGSDTIFGEHSRYWDEEVIYDNPENVEYPFIIDQNDEAQTTLSLYENMYAGYFMGDPLYQDYYEEYGHGSVEPRVAYYDYKSDLFVEDAAYEGILGDLDFEIIDVTYAEPIENSFSFSGVRYEADHVSMLILVSLVFLLLCLIFVRKDKEYQYRVLDKVGIGFNFAMGLVAVPFISICCMLFGLVESRIELINQVTYNTPTIAVICLALSIALRRKGYSKTGFVIQFGGILPFAVILALDALG